MEQTSLNHSAMQPRSIPIPSGGKSYLSLLGGPPDSVSMRSGYVELLPGESVGLHNTENCEELIVPLSGHGQLTSPGADPLPITINFVLYNPPNTPHDVVNTGDVPLRYIYIVTTSSKIVK
jgi:mannose-6-phosphate isomerase-like protein (cupin superfamily)